MTRTEDSNSAPVSSSSSTSTSTSSRTDLRVPGLIAGFVASTAAVGWATGLIEAPTQSSVLLGAGAVAVSILAATVGRAPLRSLGRYFSSSSWSSYSWDREGELTIGQYTLGEKIGQGGMGEVYRARHSMMDRDVAVKILPIDHADAEGCRRFEREVLMTSHLESPNTVAIYDYGRTTDGRFYYVMEHIDGYDLEHLVRKFGALSPARTVHILRQICGALGEAHSVGLVHRDVKPSNLALCERAGVKDVVKVLDFGLVEELDEVGDSEEYGGPSHSPSLTGTPAYLAPESILEPSVIDPRADLYALGAVAYWLLTGTNVFDGNSIVEICSHHLHTAPESLSERLGENVPADLEAIVLRCLAKNPDDRFSSMEELSGALERCECAHEWTSELAQSWWNENEPREEVKSSDDGPTSSSSSSRSNRFRSRKSRPSSRRPTVPSSSGTGLTEKLASKLLGCVLSPQG